MAQTQGFAESSHPEPLRAKDGPRVPMTSVHAPTTNDITVETEPQDFDGNDGTEDDEDEEDEEEEDEIIELPLVENPCKTIRTSLINALEENRDTSGSFFSSKTYIDAPNPMVDVKGFGVLGLPLNVAEAKRLISVCEQAPFGMGERTVIDKSVRDTWEIDASKIKCRNSAWDAWVGQIAVPQICSNLGVNMAITKVKAQMYKLLVYEEGSHFLPHQDTEKTPGMFATIVIILPSEFRGGSLQLTHADMTQNVDISSSSGTSTSVLAWYTDVFHSVKPISSGHRLALSYNLIRTSTESLKPSAQLLSSSSGKLGHIMLSWKQAHDGRLDFQVPDTLLYLLDHEYSEINLASCALKGKDASLIAQLQPIAAEMGFGLYIANAELHQTGQANDMGCGYGRRRRYDYYDDYEDEYSDDGDDDVSMCEVEEETFSLSNAVDLDGTPIDINFDSSMDDVIPQSFANGNPSNQEYEGYMGNYGGNLEYWYHRTVVIFSPNKEYVKFGDVAQCARECLSRSRTLQPTGREKALVRQLVSRIQYETSPESFVKALTSSAFRWKNINVWNDTFDGCPDNLKLKHIGVGTFCLALMTFGFPSLEDQLNTALFADNSNSRRLNLVLGLLQHSTANATLRAWCDMQNESIINSLRKPSIADVDAFIHVVKRHGTGILRDTILPQLAALTTACTGDMPFWDSFLQRLMTEVAGKAANLEDLDLLIHEQVVSLVNGAETFPIRIVARTGYYHYGAKDEKVAEVDLWIKVFRLCISTGAVDQCSRFFARISAGFANMQEVEKVWITDKFIVPFMTTLNTEHASIPSTVDAKSALSEFYRFALEAYIRSIVRQGQSHFSADVLFIALRHTGDVQLLRKTLSPLMLDIVQQNQPVAVNLVSHLSEKKGTIGLDRVGIDCCKEVIGSLLHTIIANANLEASSTTGYQYSHYGRSSQHEVLGLNFVKLCFSAECPEQLSTLLGRLLCPKTNCDLKRQISDGLVPLLPHLRTFLESKGRSLKQEPFATFTAKVIKGYVNTVMGSKPNEVVPFAQLKAVGCGCSDCGKLRSFFTTGTRVTGIQAVQRVRTHLERELERTRRWGVTWTTVRSGSPHTLQITKSSILYAPSEWLDNQATGRKMLQSVGNEPDLREILGSSLEVIASTVGMKLSLPRTAASTIITSASASTSRGVKRGSTTGTQQHGKKKKVEADVIDLTESPTK